MLLIFLSWIYILFTTINLGFITNKILVLKNFNFVVTAILGLFTTTVIASIWAIFGRINIEFHLFFLCVNLFIFLKFNPEIKSIYSNFTKQLRELVLPLKLFLTVIFVLIIAQCASIPYVIDNESYYIQTIKWLNEYGFVKGLVNLHFFLGQVSGWHITQSVYNFSFLYSNFNDLSGFCLLLGNVFAIEKLNEYFVNKNKLYLIIGLLPLANLFFFQFISAPSPDIPVYIFSFVLFFYLIEDFKKITIHNFTLIVILILFLLYIKNTTLTFALIPIVLFVLNFKSLSKQLLKPVLIAFFILALFITKNMIICGSPVFPSKLFDFSTLDYAIPNSIEHFYYEQLKVYGYYLTSEEYYKMSTWQLFLKWLSLPKLNGLFNKLTIALLVVSPIFIYKFFNKKAIWLLYFLMIIQLLIMFKTSPQFRFFINFTFFFSLFCFGCLIRNKKIITALLLVSLLPTVIILFIPIDLNRFSNNKFMMEISVFSTKNILFPYKNSKYNSPFEPIQIGNLKYNSPVENDFFWGCGDGAIPCVNKVQMKYFETYFNTIPQMRTNDLKDGFYPKNTNTNAP
jgi:hypothetical protein